MYPALPKDMNLCVMCAEVSGIPVKQTTAGLIVTTSQARSEVELLAYLSVISTYYFIMALCIC